MAVLMILAVLGILGLPALLWTAAGWTLGSRDGGCRVCVCGPDGKEGPFLERAAMLKRLGLLAGPVLLVDMGISEQMKKRMKNEDFRLVSPEGLLEILELERNQLA